MRPGEADPGGTGRGAGEVDPLRWVIGEDDAGERLDSLLAELAGISRSQARRWIDEGRVQLGARPCRGSQRVRAGDRVDASPPEPLPSPLRPEPIALSILYEDEDLIVVDKPAGLVVHPGPGHAGGTLVNALLHHCGDLAGVGGVTRPGIVHRLDRGTSGVIVAAKNDAAHQALALQFQDHSIEREYRAVVRGLPGAESGRIEGRIGRHPRDRKRMSVHADAGREAVTAWRVLRRFPRNERSWLAIRPETGRTHQIRVHLASVGLPIAGDPVYGRGKAAKRPRSEAEPSEGGPLPSKAAKRPRSEAEPSEGGPLPSKAAKRPRSEAQLPKAEGRGGKTGRAPARTSAPELDRPALHAALLGFRHPRSGRRLRFEAPLPADLAALLEDLERREGGG